MPYDRLYYLANRERIIAKAIAYERAHREKRNAYRREYRKRKPEGITALRRRLLRRYDLTPQDYDSLLGEQGGVCAICAGPQRAGLPMILDHDHTTGRLRGLLCTPCNLLLGYVRDDPNVLRAAIHYLARYSEPAKEAST